MRRFVLLLTAVASCSEDLPGTLPELQEVAVQARDEAVAARGRKDPKGAAVAADRAAAALTAAEKLGEGPETGAIRLASRAARLAAGLADEEKKHADAVGSLKARGYRAARSVALTGLFKGLALAADQAAKGKLDELPEAVRSSAVQAARISGRLPLQDGSTDWPGVSADLQAMAAAPPVETGLYLAVAFALLGQTDLGLVEISAIDAAALDKSDLPVFFVVRHFLTSTKQWNLLAAEQVGAFQAEAKGAPELIAGLHLYLAYAAIKEKDYERADAQISQSLVLWPNNPVAVYLTGERLAADGRAEAAAESLEKATAGTDQEELSRKLAQRARDLRDGKAEGKALFADPAFVTEVALHLLAQAAKRSPEAKKAIEWVESARAFGGKVLGAIPGL